MNTEMPDPADRPAHFDVFISYSSLDKQVADAVKHGLHSAGIRCWMAPDDIAPGKDWAAEVADAIDACPVMVLIWTEASMRSTEVPKELGLAMSSGTIVIPFRLENIQPQGSFKYHLTGRHWLDAYDKQLDEAIQQLIGLAALNLKQAPGYGVIKSTVLATTRLEISGQAIESDEAGIFSSETAAEEKQAVPVADTAGDQASDKPVKNSPNVDIVYLANEMATKPTESPATSDDQIALVEEDPDTTELKSNYCQPKPSAADILPIKDHGLKMQEVSNPGTLAVDDVDEFEHHDAEVRDAISYQQAPSVATIADTVSNHRTQATSYRYNSGDYISSQLEAEAALLEYSVSVLVPELSKKLFKQGLISKTLLGKRDVPTPQALVKKIAESLSWFHLSVFTLIYYLDPECMHTIEDLKRAVRQSTRESCNLLHKTANALLAKLTAPAEELAINDDHADEILEFYCDEVDCGVEYDEDGQICNAGAYLGRTTWHQGKNITWSSLFVSLSSSLDECNYDALLSAVIFTADVIIPSSPCFAEVIDAKLIDFIRWSLDVNTCSLQAFIANEVKVANVNNAHFNELRCALDSGSLGSIKDLAGYRKTAKGLRLVRQFRFPFAVLARLKELKENAGMRVDGDNITPVV